MTAVDDRWAPPALAGGSGARLAGTDPGAGLAVAVDGVQLEDCSDEVLLELVLAYQRLVSWATAGAAAAAAALGDRAVMNPAWPSVAGSVAVPDVTAEELALALGWSRRAAGTLVRDGRAYRGALMPTGDALASGALSPVKARILVDALDAVPVELALDVQDAVLPEAASRTPSQLGRDIARALLVADPAGARTRHDVAARGRRLDRPRVLPDGMAGIWAVLPAHDAIRLDSTIDAVARGGRAAGDPRTLDQLRADTLLALVLGDHPADAGGTRNASTRTTIEVRVSLSSLLGLDDGPGELAGYGPITAEAARALARGGTWRRLVTDPLSGAVLDVGRTRYRPPEDLADHVRVRDRTCARPGCSARAHSCDLDHTVPFASTPSVARDASMAAAGSAVRDPHGDGPGGRTAADNLGPLCRRDHLVKTHGGFTLRQSAPGVFEWTTPLGRTYVVTPGLDESPRLGPPPF